MTNRGGFTLVEVIVALTLTGLVATLAYQFAGGVADGTRAVERAAEVADREGNRRAWLAQAFAATAAGVEDSTGFIGLNGGVPGHETDQVHWASRPGTTDEVVRLQLRLTASGEVVAKSGNGSQRTVAEGVRSLGIDYLPVPGAGVAWLHAWSSPVSAPAAVRVRFAFHDGTADTMLHVTGSRP